MKSTAHFERTPIGDQGVIPGAEKASTAALLQRRADAPLRPDRWQKRCDEGLFGDQHTQTDLIDQIRRKS